MRISEKLSGKEAMKKMDFGVTSRPPFVKLEKPVVMAFISDNPDSVFWQDNPQGKRYASEKAAIDNGLDPQWDKHTVFVVYVGKDAVNGDGNKFVNRKGEPCEYALLDVKRGLKYSLHNSGVKRGQAFRIKKQGAMKNTRYEIEVLKGNPKDWPEKAEDMMTRYSETEYAASGE